MPDDPSTNEQATGDSFAKAAEEPQPGFFRDFWLFLRFNKKWWITPILVVLLGVGALIMLGGTSVAPFIYTLF